MTRTSFSKNIRVAILIGIKFSEQISQSKGQFDTIFNTWIQDSLRLRVHRVPCEEDFTITTRKYDVIKGDLPHPSDIDALIITGSDASVYNKDPWIESLQCYIKDLYNQHPHIRIFGGCFGHQIVARALLGNFGVQVENNPNGWALGVHDIILTPEFQSRFPKLLDTGVLSQQFFHKDQVVIADRGLPADWVLLGSTPSCKVQGLYNAGRVLTYQGHPELDAFVISQSLSIARKANTFPEPFNISVNYGDCQEQSLLAGQVFLEFLIK